jgi:hypothetical protein
MGISPFSRSSEGTNLASANPNPRNYVVESQEQIGKFLILTLRYPDCVNYEGRKVLLYKNVSFAELEKQGSIDPHFSGNPEYLSPIARFEPTREGRLMAVALARMLS